MIRSATGHAGERPIVCHCCKSMRAVYGVGTRRQAIFYENLDAILFFRT